MPFTLSAKLNLMAIYVSVHAVALAGTLSGKIVDVTGASVGGAYVFAYNNQLHVTDTTALPGKSVISQADGSFILDLAPGFYDICIFSAGFTASCKKVLMSSADVKGYKVKLSVSPLVIKERGDRFSTN